MKKTLTLLAILAAIGPAWGAEVVSSNIVGYNKVNLYPGLTMAGIQFQAIGDSNREIDIQDVVSIEGLTGFDWDSFDGGDQMIIWSPSDQLYTTTYVWSDADPFGAGTENKWIDDSFSPAEDVLKTGDAVFFNSSSDKTLTAVFSGEVSDMTAAISLHVSPGLTMLANPFPFELKINENMTPSGLVGFDWDSFDGGDQLIVWNPEEQLYDETYIWSDSDPFGTGTQNKWIDDSFSPAEASIPVGGAFFINTSGEGGSISFAPAN